MNQTNQVCAGRGATAIKVLMLMSDGTPRTSLEVSKEIGIGVKCAQESMQRMAKEGARQRMHTTAKKGNALVFVVGKGRNRAKGAPSPFKGIPIEFRSPAPAVTIDPTIPAAFHAMCSVGKADALLGFRVGM